MTASRTFGGGPAADAFLGAFDLATVRRRSVDRVLGAFALVVVAENLE